MKFVTALTLLLMATAVLGQPVCCVVTDCCQEQRTAPDRDLDDKPEKPQCRCCAPERPRKEAQEPQRRTCDCSDKDVDHSLPPAGIEFAHPLDFLAVVEIELPDFASTWSAVATERATPPRAHDAALTLPLLL